MRRALHLAGAALLGALASVAGPAPATAQSLHYAPPQGVPFRYRTANTLTVSQQVLGRENHYTLRSGGVVRLTLLNPGERMLWRLGFDELTLEIEGPFPTPRVEELRGTVVTLATTPRGVVLEALAAGVVSPGLGTQYVERAAAAFFPHLPSGEALPGTSWTDTLSVTEVLQGVTAEVQTVVTYTVADTSAFAGHAVLPIDYVGRIAVTGAGTVAGTGVSRDGDGRVEGSYLYSPADGVFDIHEQEQVLESTLTLEGPDRAATAIPSRQVLHARAERLF